MKPYRAAPEARADLAGIWDYIAKRASPEMADNFVSKFDEIFASIAASPRAGISMPNLPPGGVRKFPMGNYLIYYRVQRRKVQILRVLHGKRVQRRAFRSKPPA